MLNILFIEDDPVLLKLLTSICRAKKLGNIDSAETKKIAQDKISKTTYDVIICDMMLPDGTGKEIIEGIQGKVPPLFLFFTGYSSVSSEELLSLGATAVLAKPEGLQTVFKDIEKFKDSLLL